MYYEIVTSLKVNYINLFYIYGLHVMINKNQHRIVKIIIIVKNFIIIY